jgi:hypothetical protein
LGTPEEVARLLGCSIQTSTVPSAWKAELPEDEDEEEEACEGHNKVVGNCHGNDLVLLWVQRMLLPLLMEEEEFLSKDFWFPEVDSAAVWAALHLIVTELRQHQDASLSAILATVQAPTSPASKESPSVVPTLKAYGVQARAGEPSARPFLPK